MAAKALVLLALLDYVPEKLLKSPLPKSSQARYLPDSHAIYDHYLAVASVGAQAAAWATRMPHKLVGLRLMQPHRFTQPKQNGWSLHDRDAAAVQLMGCLLQCIQCGSSLQADASHGAMEVTCLRENCAFAGTRRTSKRRGQPVDAYSLPGNAVGVREAATQRHGR